jgi:hypothetical protein
VVTIVIRASPACRPPDFSRWQPSAGFSKPLFLPGCAPHSESGMAGAARQGVRLVRFALDSPLEGDGFEPSVPRDRDDGFRSNSPARLLPERDPRSEPLLLRHRICLTDAPLGIDRQMSPQTREAVTKRDRRPPTSKLAPAVIIKFLRCAFSLAKRHERPDIYQLYPDRRGMPFLTRPTRTSFPRGSRFDLFDG